MYLLSLFGGIKTVNVFKQFFNIRETYIGIGAALIFQLVFFSVWLTAYDGVSDRIDHLKIAVINEDDRFGKPIANSIIEEASFQAAEIHTLEKAKKEMNLRKWNMIVYIPSTFTKDLQTKGTSNIKYYINQSSPTLSKQIMESAATAITSTINKEMYTVIQKQINEQLPKEVAIQTPNPEIAEQLAKKIVEEMQGALQINPVTMSIIKTNDVKGFAATMIPLLMILASFVGAMIMSQQLQFATQKLITLYNKWMLFFAKQMINLLLSLTLALLTLGLMALYKMDMQTSLLTVWLFQSLLFFSFLCFTQVFVILFGNPGMIFNIIAMATQLVSSGTIVPREMLSSFYWKIGSFLPATYGANGYFSLIYGGGDLAADTKSLMMLVGAAILIAVGKVAFSPSMIKTNRRDEVRA